MRVSSKYGQGSRSELQMDLHGKGALIPSFVQVIRIHARLVHCTERYDYHFAKCLDADMSKAS